VAQRLWSGVLAAPLAFPKKRRPGPAAELGARASPSFKKLKKAKLAKLKKAELKRAELAKFRLEIVPRGCSET